MTYTVQDATGSFETIVETMGALIKRSWDSSLTNGITPIFVFNQDEAHPRMLQHLNDSVKFEKGTRSGFNETDSAIDNSQGEYDNDVIITVNATSQYMGELMELHIVKLLRDNYRQTVLKSDNTSVSGIRRWNWPIPKFQSFGYGSESIDSYYSSQIILTVKTLMVWA